MDLSHAQFEMRSAFFGGFVGQLVSGVIWATAAGLGTWVAPRYAMVFLFFASMALFPLTQWILRRMGRPARLSPGNTLNQLAMQIAFTVPINFLLVGAATLYRQNWFFPAASITVGAHYLPFIFLYGMPHFGILGGIMIATGTLVGLYAPGWFSLCGWITAVILLVFAFAGRQAILAEESVRAAKTS